MRGLTSVVAALLLIVTSAAIAILLYVNVLSSLSPVELRPDLDMLVIRGVKFYDKNITLYVQNIGRTSVNLQDIDVILTDLEGNTVAEVVRPLWIKEGKKVLPPGAGAVITGRVLDRLSPGTYEVIVHTSTGSTAKAIISVSKGFEKGEVLRSTVYITFTKTPSSIGWYTIKLTLNSSWKGWKYVEENNFYFTDSKGDPLYFWVERMDPSSKKGTIWVKVPLSGEKRVKVFMYIVVGRTNPYLNYEDPSKVFDFFISPSTFDASRWSIHIEGQGNLSGIMLSLRNLGDRVEISVHMATRKYYQVKGEARGPYSLRGLVARKGYSKLIVDGIHKLLEDIEIEVLVENVMYLDMIEFASRLKLLPSDAIIAPTCRHYGIDTILTFDEDFRRAPWLKVIS